MRQMRSLGIHGSVWKCHWGNETLLCSPRPRHGAGCQTQVTKEAGVVRFGRRPKPPGLIRNSTNSFPAFIIAAGPDVEVVAESDSAAVVWKRPGIPITRKKELSKTSHRGRRPEEALTSRIKRLWGPGAQIVSDLESWSGGLVLVSKDPANLDAFIEARSNICATFEAVVILMDERCTEFVKGQQKLQLVSQVLIGSTSAAEACEALAVECRTPVAGRTGSPELEGLRGAQVALVQLSNLPEEAGLGGSVKHLTPKKFLKLIRRAEIRSDRRAELHVARDQEVTADFCGFPFFSSAPQLIPRKSSEAVVKAAIDSIKRQKAGSPASVGREDVMGPRVLDLGTGCGCLLLSVLRQCGKPEAYGVGVELNKQALDFAKRNIEAMVSQGEIQEEQVKLVKADFGKLHTKSVYEELVSTHGAFDIIVSNPPFLAENRAKGRVTAEHSMVLVGGETGMEAYEAICKSIAMCTPPLLRPGGLLLLQAPGGNRGHIRVGAVARKSGFEVMESICDERGVHRTILCKLANTKRY